LPHTILPAGDVCIAERSFSDASASFFEIADCQIDQLGCSIVCREAATGFDGFADHPVEAFDDVGGVDDFAHGWQEGEERDQLLPRPLPTWGN
jgi:hypothetical protein